MLTVSEAEELLKWANECNKGPWYDHSCTVADAAGKIAGECGLNEDKAIVLGLLHDFGRYVGPTSMMHIYDGYMYFTNKEEHEIAQICITHSFPINDIIFYSGVNDCEKKITDKIASLLTSYQYTDYDRLIQLCDSIALPTGVTLLEKRLIDVAMRHGINDTTIRKWEKIYEIKSDFEKRMNKSIYSLFPEVTNTIFE